MNTRIEKEGNRKKEVVVGMLAILFLTLPLRLSAAIYFLPLILVIARTEIKSQVREEVKPFIHLAIFALWAIASLVFTARENIEQGLVIVEKMVPLLLASIVGYFSDIKIRAEDLKKILSFLAVGVLLSMLTYWWAPFNWAPAGLSAWDNVENSVFQYHFFQKVAFLHETYAGFHMVLLPVYFLIKGGEGRSWVRDSFMMLMIGLSGIFLFFFTEGRMVQALFVVNIMGVIVFQLHPFFASRILRLISYASLGVIFFVTVLFVVEPSVIGKISILGSREYLWEAASSIINQHPIIGEGIGDAKYLLKDEVLRLTGDGKLESLNSHNQYLSIWLMCGLIGLLLFLSFLLSVLRCNSRSVLLPFFILTASSVLIFENFLERNPGVVPFSLYLFIFMKYAPTSLPSENDKRLFLGKTK